MKKEIEEKIIKWLLSQGEYVGTIGDLSNVCLDGNFNIKKLTEIIINQALQQERERITNKIKARLKYCQEQNGLPYCKNCGLSLDDLTPLNQ